MVEYDGPSPVMGEDCSLMASCSYFCCSQLCECSCILQLFIGGNAALMAQKLAQLTSNDTEVFLGGPVGRELRELLNPRLRTMESKKEDEFHMILEYVKGDKWGSVTAECANRFIFSNDVANSELSAVDRFFDHIDSHHPELVIVSGVHLLDRFSGELQQKKLDRLADRLQRLSDPTVVHLELASIGSLELVRRVLTTLLPHLTSLGLNEQELTAAVQAGGGPLELLVDMDPPEVGIVADMMLWLLTKYGNVDGGNPQSRLSRVHFHSLTFHVVAHAHDTWANANTAVFRGTEAAGRQACADEAIVPSKMQLRIPSAFYLSIQDKALRRQAHIFDPNHPQLSWQRGRIDYHFSPVLVCRRPLKTVGLGDAISATGLLYSKYLGAMITGNV